MRKWIQLALLVLCFFCLSGAALAASAVTPDGYFNGIRLAGKVRVVDSFPISASRLSTISPMTSANGSSSITAKTSQSNSSIPSRTSASSSSTVSRESPNLVKRLSP